MVQAESSCLFGNTEPSAGASNSTLGRPSPAVIPGGKDVAGEAVSVDSSFGLAVVGATGLLVGYPELLKALECLSLRDFLALHHRKNMAPRMMATPATTPTTIPAMAPRPRLLPELVNEPLLVLVACFDCVDDGFGCVGEDLDG